VIDREHAPSVGTASPDDAFANDDAPRAWRVTIDLSATRTKGL